METTSKRIGIAEGKFVVPNDFDACNDKIAEMFGVKSSMNILLTNFCSENPYKPLSRDEILSEIAQSRASYEQAREKILIKQLMKYVSNMIDKV